MKTSLVFMLLLIACLAVTRFVACEAGRIIGHDITGPEQRLGLIYRQ